MYLYNLVALYIFSVLLSCLKISAKCCLFFTSSDVLSTVNNEPWFGITDISTILPSALVIAEAIIARVPGVSSTSSFKCVTNSF